MSGIVILLTGCVKPNVDDVLMVKDVDIRCQQYVCAIEWYLKNTSYNVVFVENSGFDVRPYLNDSLVNVQRLELLTYNSSSNVADGGKGYKEMEIIEYALLNAVFLKKASIIVKGTGRLILKNINKVLPAHSEEINFISSWMSVKRQTSDSRFFWGSRSFFEFFLTYKSNINKHCNFEDNLCAAIMAWRDKGFRYIYPKLWYDVSGVGGGYGAIYDVSKKVYYARCAKNFIYRVVFALGYWPNKKNVY